MAEPLVDRVGIPADFDTTHLCRRALPGRRYWIDYFGCGCGVGGTPNLRAAPSSPVADADRVKGASG